MFSLSDYDYHLPEDRIAQKPAKQRDASRLLRLRRRDGRISHHVFRNLDQLFVPGDVLVVNNTEVIPARLIGRKETGGRVEVLILDVDSETPSSSGERVCRCLINASKRPKKGSYLTFGKTLAARVEQAGGARCRVRFSFNGDFEKIINRIGQVPLPPYIRRRGPAAAPCDDRKAYQCVYASEKGAVAAPTAGLHFTPELMRRLTARGIIIAEITLHVGYGTFEPVRVSDIRHHKMHAERFFIPDKTAAIVNKASESGSRVVAVGTTCVRTLEYAADAKGVVRSGKGVCDLYIFPGYQFKRVDAMITNFHLPRSTLLMLVAAFAGRRRILAAYEEAVDAEYRFFSYGDAMFID